MSQLHYKSYADYFRGIFGGRAQKLSIDAGFTCPNRDGMKGSGGCTFCNNEAFNPSYCRKVGGITEQIEEGIRFHEWRYKKAVRYLAYFQTYSNTYARLEVLKSRYEEALNHPAIAGIVIGTRPDCVDEEKLDYVASLGKDRYVAIEYGIESCYDRTLKRIERGHGFEETRRAIEATAKRGIHCGGHIILGLPGETKAEMTAEVEIINQLPLNTVKFHQLQILKGTKLAEAAQGDQGMSFELGEYVELICNIVERLRPDMAIERFAGEVPPRYQAKPERSWRRADGKLVRNEEIVSMVERELERRGTFQGQLYKNER